MSSEAKSASPDSGPTIVNSLLEARAALEVCALPYAYPFLLRSAEPSDGQPVLLIPGFTASDNSTWFVRKFLKRLGYDVYGWGQGANNGLRAATFAALEQRLSEIHHSTGRRVSLVGWSSGGFYARALANKHVGQVHNVVTVGTTFAMPTPKAVNRVINRLYGHLNPYQQDDAFFVGSDLWEYTPMVPSTSIYSKGDGVNGWQYCLDQPGALSENVQICGSHCGLTMNPLVFYVLADRLAQDVERWQAYTPPKTLRRWRVGLVPAN